MDQDHDLGRLEGGHASYGPAIFRGITPVAILDAERAPSAMVVKSHKRVLRQAGKGNVEATEEAFASPGGLSQKLVQS
jgi:hypothetical protein